MVRPTPPHERRILCTSCGGLLSVAREAKSVNCRHCHQRVICEPLVLKDYVAVRKLRTANAIHITKKGNVVASLWCEDLKVDGRLKGDAISLGGMQISKRAQVQADLRARSLSIADGAELRGEMRIGPEQIPLHEAMVASDEAEDA